MMRKRSVVRVVGPLEPFAAVFGLELERRGYTGLTIDQQLRLMAHVSRWLVSEDLKASDISPERFEEFCAARREAGYTALRTVRALGPLRAFLEGQGAVALPEVGQATSAEEVLIERYRTYLGANASWWRMW